MAKQEKIVRLKNGKTVPKENYPLLKIDWLAHGIVENNKKEKNK